MAYSLPLAAFYLKEFSKMQLYSTQKQSKEVSFQQAIFQGLPPDNGLYVPKQVPTLPASFFDNIESLSLPEIAIEVTKALLGDEIPEADLERCVRTAINFDAPVKKLDEQVYVQELFHGPTLAFKDFGARFMAQLMGYWQTKQATDASATQTQDIHILVATSGDTGGAVAQGFYQVPGIKVVVLYPAGKVSPIQEKQFSTLGENVTAIAIDGTFDDCQKLVKQAFLNDELRNQLPLSSANSINISRLIPQSFYYFYAYAQLKHLGKKLVFTVPSGNLGNLCGGLLAQQMGLPVHGFVSATNKNNVFPQFLQSGEFTPHPSFATISNAMDVGNPSNFARIKEWLGDDYQAFEGKITGKYYNDEETKETIKKVFAHSQYVLDPHSAIGYRATQEYLANKDDDIVGVFLSTAHPAKFLEVVEQTIGQKLPIPEKLQEVMDNPNKNLTMSNSFEEFKAYLMKAFAEA
ncbi:threonine synthase [Microscilla marina ATCC 23134]|uniref:Threonine synthase n=2 Tax=Microscilla marina TaxID=1027 RepID=A1ZLX0_MICM2|nr:threonine synthase [Microscilla marina ATCC 23134]